MLQVCVIASLDPAVVGPDQDKVVVGNTAPSVLHTSHIFVGYADKEKLCNSRCISGCLGAAIGSPWIAGA